MERILLSKNQNNIYFSLRFEKGDPLNKLFCLDCPLIHNACSIDTGVADRIVARINLQNLNQKISEEYIKSNCGDIRQLLK